MNEVLGVARCTWEGHALASLRGRLRKPNVVICQHGRVLCTYEGILYTLGV